MKHLKMAVKDFWDYALSGNNSCQIIPQMESLRIIKKWSSTLMSF